MPKPIALARFPVESSIDALPMERPGEHRCNALLLDGWVRFDLDVNPLGHAPIVVDLRITALEPETTKFNVFIGDEHDNVHWASELEGEHSIRLCWRSHAYDALPLDTGRKNWLYVHLPATMTNIALPKVQIKHTPL